MRFEVVTVTPQLAARWLEKNTHNRRLTQANVNKMAADMREGRWMLTAEPVIFDSDGKMQDGQHRAWAVVESGCNIRMTVAYDADPAAFHVINTGAVRPAGQILEMAGLVSGNVVAASTKMILRYYRWPDKVWSSQTTDVSKAEVVEYAITHPPLFPEHVGLIGRLPGMTRSSAVAAYNVILGGSPNADDWDSFWRPVTTGEGLTAGDPRLALRNRGMNSTVRRWGQGQSDMFSVLVAWNHWLSGSSVAFIKTTAIMLPMPKPL